eukprot:TRINITY_DN62941_c0_g1_i1.p1 TRINITY_DN62941_c0_g1~~TRINITY_DN62941_c0_g1_i1.p1  ORF type:complete len:534 (+),score=51.27 TRINITY_DN62941_c0_g1_i1:176-1603(+)
MACTSPPRHGGQVIEHKVHLYSSTTRTSSCLRTSSAPARAMLRAPSNTQKVFSVSQEITTSNTKVKNVSVHVDDAELLTISKSGRQSMSTSSAPASSGNLHTAHMSGAHLGEEIALTAHDSKVKGGVCFVAISDPTPRETDVERQLSGCPSELNQVEDIAHDTKRSVNQYADETQTSLVKSRLVESNTSDETTCSASADEHEDETQGELVESESDATSTPVVEADSSVSASRASTSDGAGVSPSSTSLSTNRGHRDHSMFGDSQIEPEHGRTVRMHNFAEAPIETTMALESSLIDGESDLGFPATISSSVPMQLFEQGWERQRHNQTSMMAKSAESRTTVLLLNVPYDYTGPRLVRTLDSEGFQGMYDFVHVPIDSGERGCSGFAFVNLVNPAIAQNFITAFEKFSRWSVKSKNVCLAVWAKKQQGLRANVDRSRNSNALLGQVPDEYKPLLFRNGIQVQFPARDATSGKPGLLT